MDAVQMDTQKSTSAFVGLFWIKKDYSGLLGPLGIKEFSEADLSNKNQIIAPTSAHRDYVSVPSKLPRGRVEVVRGEIHIYAGRNFPDSLTEEVINLFNLSPYRDKIKVIRGYHWDSKNSFRK